MLIHSASAIRRARPGVAVGGGSYPIYNYQSLEIYAPRPGLTTTNRYYKAYPDPTGSLGIPYNVKAAVAGGAWPYTYELTTKPTGMTINSTTGEINWSQPTATGSPHSVTMRVTDQLGAQATVSWTITVTTSGFYFVDRVNGLPSDENGGTATGLINDPWQTIRDVYGTIKHQDRNPGSFVYFKNGVYELNTIVEDALGEHRTPWTERRANVLMAYPGHSPEIRYNYGGYTHRIHFYAAGTDNPDIYIEGFTFNDNGAYRGIVVALTGATRHILRNLTIHGATQIPIDNHSGLFFTGGNGQYSAVLDCSIYNCASHYAILQYGYDKILIENLVSYNTAAGVGPKNGNSYMTVRGCSIKASGRVLWTQSYITSYGNTTNLEWHHNYLEQTPNNTDFYTAWNILTNNESSHPDGPYWIYRNTIKGNVRLKALGATDGETLLKDNLILTDTGGANGVVEDTFTDPTKLVEEGNIVDVYSSALIDANGNLQGAGLQYLGTKGWELE